MNPYVVARRVHTIPLLLGCWLLGGLVALAGAFIYAELAALRPSLVGGQYAYLREAYHPAVGFMYGWALLLVIQTGGMAAVAITFARYFLDLTHLPLAAHLLTIPVKFPFITHLFLVDITREGAVAALTLGGLVVINCVGVKAGSTVQSVLMAIKVLAILMLVLCALWFSGMVNMSFSPVFDRPVSFGLLAAIGAAMGPVMFSYGGWHTASFVAAEMRRPDRDLSRGLLFGVLGVVLLYLAANAVYVGVLGAQGLSQATTPASSLMRLALGERGASLMAVGIAVSALGFLSQSMLTAPRVYFAMAADKLFFKSVAKVGTRSRVPFVAIALQGIMATAIALSQQYEHILDYVVSVDFIAYGLTATCIFVFRRREAQARKGSGPPAVIRGFAYRVPGHPYTTILFTATCWAVVAGTVYSYPRNTVIGLGIVLAGIPVYFFWRWWRRDQ